MSDLTDTDVKVEGQEVEEIRAFIRRKVKDLVVPASVYRVQLNKDFGFKKARDLVPALSEMGVDALYCSPYFQAEKGSAHGYNIIDCNAINCELGSELDFSNFCDALKRHGLKQILDVVPNHMGITGDNKLWKDVLENGPSSVYAHFFDIDWSPMKKELQDKVLLPILGDSYGRVLENQEIKLVYDCGEFTVRYWDHHLPVAPRTYSLILEFGLEKLKQELGEDSPELAEYLSVITAFRNLPARTEKNAGRIRERHREREVSKNRLADLAKRSRAVKEFIESRVSLFNGNKGDARSFDVLDQLLAEQGYRLAFWRVASEEINYRRFFDVNDLAAICIEHEDVFEYHHRLVFRWIAEGKIQGLRVDHPDGLYDPPDYFRRLQERYLLESLCEGIEQNDPKRERFAANLRPVLKEEEFLTCKPLYVVVEKILDRRESLPEDWNVHGTVGYDFLNALNGIFVDSRHERPFDAIYGKFVGRRLDFDFLAHEKKKFFALVHMASELNNLGRRLNLISEKNRHYRDFTLNSLVVAIREVIAAFPVYRTYISPLAAEVSARDERYIRMAIEKARKKAPALPSAIFEFLQDILLLKVMPRIDPEEKIALRNFILRFQQLTGPITAKGVEDTSFYIYNRLLSLNEVGGYPTHFGCTAEEFHQENMHRNARWPAGFITTSTHDTKRSEDVRMRINVLSEMPKEWEECVQKWAAENEHLKTKLNEVLQPDRNTEYFIYQTLVGVWPDEEIGERGAAVFAERLCAYFQKANREAKTETNWVNPNEVYESAVKKFVCGVLERTPKNRFPQSFLEFEKKVAVFGKWNSLGALVLKLGSPGVLDTYQGTELWNYRLVDPDNREPVDFNRIRNLHADVLSQTSGGKGRAVVETWFRSPEDARIKLVVFSEGLRLRRSHPELFVGGEYIPLKVTGEAARHVVAFLRRSGSKLAIAVTGRFYSQLPSLRDGFPLGKKTWGDTKVMFPKDIELPPTFRDILTHQEIASEKDFLPVAGLFEKLPFALLFHD
ncbi:MAG: malto-oligosyltrehalose synthase [Candidatus Omnitrophota bacterium]|nr:malto-oligosyltrehalose synthase [Candidatus Omnitrophota bacterium]